MLVFFAHHPKAAATPKGISAVFKAIHVLETQWRTLEAVKEAKAKAAAAFPPHHQLWECIAKFEAPHTNYSSTHPDGLDWSWGAGVTSGSGHWGGMGFGWGWGSMEGSAGNYSQHDQEWAAENSWAASGYSYGFLYGNWYEWDNADGCGTTG